MANASRQGVYLQAISEGVEKSSCSVLDLPAGSREYRSGESGLDRLAQEGVTDAVPISTTEKMSIHGDLAARYFRVFFGMK